MFALSRMAALFLLVTVTALPALPMMPRAGSGAHLAGCHGNRSGGSQTPSPAPVSFQCCVNGHHAALPNAMFSWQTLQVQISAAGEGNFSMNSTPAGSFVIPLLSSASPPKFPPLRV